MDDIFSKMIVIILISILLCIIPAFYITIYTDFNSYLYKNNQVEFVLDQITLKGYLMDDELLNDDNLSINVERDIYMPDNEEFVPFAFSKKTIIENINDKGIQKFECGDVVTITYALKNSSFIFLNKLFNINNNIKYITYSSVVKNECY